MFCIAEGGKIITTLSPCVKSPDQVSQTRTKASFATDNRILLVMLRVLMVVLSYGRAFRARVSSTVASRERVLAPGVGINSVNSCPVSQNQPKQVLKKGNHKERHKTE